MTDKDRILEFMDSRGATAHGIPPSRIRYFLEYELKKSELRAHTLIQEMLEEGTLVFDAAQGLWRKEVFEKYIAEREKTDRLFAAVADRLMSVGVEVLGRSAYSSSQMIIDTKSLARWLGVTEAL